MILISSNYVNHKTQSVLHLIYYKDKQNPHTKIGLGSVRSDTMNIFRVGEQITTWSYIKAFPTILLHPVSEQYWEDMLATLIRYKFHEWLKEYAKIKEKELIIIGNSVRMLSKNPVLFRRQEGIGHNFTKTMSIVRSMVGANIDNHRNILEFENGLDIFPYALDIDFVNKSTLKNDPKYTENIEHYSDKKPVYLLDPGVCITSQDLQAYRAFYGEWFKIYKRKVIKLTEMSNIIKGTKLSRLTGRELKPMKAIYKENLTLEEQRQAEDILSKIKEI